MEVFSVNLKSPIVLNRVWYCQLYCFFVYLNDLLCQLRDQNIGCHMNSHFVGAIIYADDITLLGPTRNSVMALLDMCRNNAHNHDDI